MKLNKWVRFILGIGMIFLFFQVVPRLYGLMPNSKPILKHISKEHIDPSALFYSEEPHTFYAEKAISEKLDH